MQFDDQKIIALDLAEEWNDLGLEVFTDTKSNN